jgi:hypothetical protein
MKVMPPIFFLENVIAVTVKYMWLIRTSFAIVTQFFDRVFVIFNRVLPTMSKTLHTKVVKFPALMLEHITKTLFHFIVI